MRKALVVGINNYRNISALYGCVNDAKAVAEVLERHEDGRVNFGVKFMGTTGGVQYVNKLDLRGQLQELFKDDSDIALFYFAGHGYVDATGGYIATSDLAGEGDGIPLNDILVWANASPAKNKLVILDSCHSGSAGNIPTSPGLAQITSGLTILTASTADQYASENNGSGVFTSLLVDALSGAAANLVGDITPGSVYAYVDQSLGPWEQRPVFKTNVQSFVSLRQTSPPVSLAALRRVVELFPQPDYIFPLDPSFEPERSGSEAAGTPAPDPANTEKFALLQQYCRVNLVTPEGAPTCGTRPWRAGPAA